uniref:Zinc finger, GRF-type n=1 Tax=Tanacetum cinerariifolium TaxID=118510 RepID=A0A6L2JIA4_TANCI|nr:zinc finger, GRF-type [Tanacetum cinerariifolium]
MVVGWSVLINELGNELWLLWVVDPPMCERSLDLIIELLRTMNVLEEDMEDHMLMLREKEQMLTKTRKYPVVACAMVIVAFKYFYGV